MYKVGWAKTQITNLSTRGHAMFGWGMWFNRATGQKTPLYARTFAVTDEAGKTAILCCLDLGYISYPMRSQAIDMIRAGLETVDMGQADFDEASFVMTATHTHSGPGGCSNGSMYNVITPGYMPEHVEAIAKATSESVLSALKLRKDTDIILVQDPFADDVGVAWNRSIAAYNANKDTDNKTIDETHLAIDRHMRVLGFERGGRLASLMSVFGVHATCVGNTHNDYNADNKGYAAVQAEVVLSELNGVGKGEHENDAPVAIFAQGTAGDVSPYFQGKGDVAKRKKLNKDDQIAYAKQNAKLQSDKAFATLENTETTENKLAIAGSIDAVMMYVDFSDVKADPDYADSEANACTADPCIGVSMFEGTRVDGPGMPKAVGAGARFLARRLKNKRLKGSGLSDADKAYYDELYRVHGNKDILMEGERKLSLGQHISNIALPGFVDPTVGALKAQAKTGAMDSHPMVPVVIPVQIIRLGNLALVCCPGEFTTMSGKRIKDMVQEKLGGAGVDVTIILSYCNEYMGYVTTQEEYQTQHYEGGHTLYGQWTQAAFQTKFAELADELLLDENARSEAYKKANALRPEPVPAEDLAKLTGLEPPKKW